MEFTQEHREKLRAYLKDRYIPEGMGTKEKACSIAAINLAISGRLTDNIPDCMSEVLGRAVITLQDAMPDKMRNREEYKSLLEDMAGTGREYEKERLSILLDWMWGTVLPQVQPIADKEFFGGEWKTMCEERTKNAAYVAYGSSHEMATIVTAENTTEIAAKATDTAARAAYAAAKAASWAVEAVCAGTYAAALFSQREEKAAFVEAYYPAKLANNEVTAYTLEVVSQGSVEATDTAVNAAVRAAVNAAQATNDDNFWKAVDPIGLLKRMTYLKG